MKAALVFFLAISISVSGLRTSGLVVVSVVGAAAVLLGAFLIQCGKSGNKCSD